MPLIITKKEISVTANLIMSLNFQENCYYLPNIYWNSKESNLKVNLNYPNLLTFSCKNRVM